MESLPPMTFPVAITIASTKMIASGRDACWSWLGRRARRFRGSTRTTTDRSRSRSVGGDGSAKIAGDY